MSKLRFLVFLLSWPVTPHGLQHFGSESNTGRQKAMKKNYPCFDMSFSSFSTALPISLDLF